MKTAALEPGSEMLHPSDPPAVLPPNEIARYQRIFALGDRAAWAEADREIRRIKDKLLIGPVLAQRYLSPSYHASYAELAAWLEHYASQPDAKAIRALALARRPPHEKALPAERNEAKRSLGDDPDAAPTRAALVARQIAGLADSAPRRAALLLAGPEARRLLDDDAREDLRALIAQSYLRADQPQETLVLTAPPPDRVATPLANWQAGLAAWRLDRPGEAREHFEALAQSAGVSPWTKSAAAFWAARAARRLGRADHARYWLAIAAEAPRTLYGVLARRVLHADPGLDFEAEPFTELDARAVSSLEAGRRALALLAVGQRGRAAAELRALAESDSPALLQSLAGLADRANLAALSLQLAGALAQSDGRRHDAALYPVPRWTPQGGFAVDRALLFALMRQESLFVPGVTSSSGAAGLMQLMPATARGLAERKGLSLESGERAALADPELNLTLAQDYVRTLLADDAIKGNLMMAALAYNRGPAAAARLQDLAAKYKNDPLLFLESIPSPQGRIFTRHVLTNYWIYRMRLGQATPDLDALAGDRWPTYIAQDQRPHREAAYAANR
ncbi:MAG TPA: lytic transglycosylase domain-containing protein [Stellaceae bacterium]|nr:lytic transglycosylase domain-containing protein [Stellaceae bacterium]